MVFKQFIPNSAYVCTIIYVIKWQQQIKSTSKTIYINSTEGTLVAKSISWNVKVSIRCDQRELNKEYIRLCLLIYTPGFHPNLGLISFCFTSVVTNQTKCNNTSCWWPLQDNYRCKPFWNMCKTDAVDVRYPIGIDNTDTSRIYCLLILKTRTNTVNM